MGLEKVWSSVFNKTKKLSVSIHINITKFSKRKIPFRLINYCAKLYQTCFINNLKLNFISTKLKSIPFIPQNDAKDVDFDAAGVKGLCHEIGMKIKPKKRSKNEKEEEEEEEEEGEEDILNKEGWSYIFNVNRIKKLEGNVGLLIGVYLQMV